MAEETLDQKHEREYRERKFRRVARTAQHASVYERWQGKGYDGKVDVEVVVKRDMRSRGYRSGYEAILTYWVLCYQNGQPYYAASKTPRALDTFLAPLKEHGLTRVA